MLIKIMNTTFGLAVDGIIKPKSPHDPPFEVDDELGARLIREGIAENVGAAVFGGEHPESNDKSNDNGNAESAGGDNFGIPQYSADSTKADLQSIAKEYGIDVPAAATKQDLIKALDNFFADALPDEAEGE